MSKEDSPIQENEEDKPPSPPGFRRTHNLVDKIKSIYLIFDTFLESCCWRFGFREFRRYAGYAFKV